MRRWLAITRILLAVLAGSAAAGAGSLAAAADPPAGAPATRPAAAAASATAADAGELTRLLNEFLAGAGGTDPAVHERFWAADLIYTGSGGRRVGKADILRDLRSAPAPSPQDPVTVFSAEEVRIQQYGTTAIVAFRLVGTTTAGATTRVARFLNTGTLVKRDGRWQAAGWQATRIPLPAEEARAQVAEAGRKLRLALQSADTLAAGSVLHGNFVWADPGGEAFTRRRLLTELASGQRIFERSEHDSTEIQVSGETAVVRCRQQLSPARRPDGADAKAPPAVFDVTLTFVLAGGEWQALGMHTRARKGAD